MNDSEYQSSVLRCNDADDDCPVCRFLNNAAVSTEDYLYVIRILDRSLAIEEQNERILSKAVIEAQRSRM